MSAMIALAGGPRLRPRLSPGGKAHGEIGGWEKAGVENGNAGLLELRSAARAFVQEDAPGPRDAHAFQSPTAVVRGADLPGPADLAPAILSCCGRRLGKVRAHEHAVHHGSVDDALVLEVLDDLRLQDVLER